MHRTRRCPLRESTVDFVGFYSYELVGGRVAILFGFFTTNREAWDRSVNSEGESCMLPASYFIAWGPGALYAELYIGMCRALAAPWLGPWVHDSRPGARPSAPAESRTPTKAPAAEPTAAVMEAIPQPPCTGALIIPFDRARARQAARPEAITS
jgi:hypothetical protein